MQAALQTTVAEVDAAMSAWQPDSDDAPEPGAHWRLGGVPASLAVLNLGLRI